MEQQRSYRIWRNLSIARLPFVLTSPPSMRLPYEVLSRKAAKKLMYACRGCGYEQEAENPVVFKHEIIKSAK